MPPLDPDVVALAKAVKQTESSGNIHAAGASGEYGAYQWMPGTWTKQAAAAGVTTPLKNATNEEQNKVWYTWAKSLKDKGYGPAQIASMQNAGEGAPDAYRQNYKGTNSKGVSYDTPKYVQEVISNYQKYKGSNPSQGNGVTANALSSSSGGGVSADALSGSSGNPFQQYAQQEQQNYVPPNPDSLGAELSNRGQQVVGAAQTGVQGVNELVHGNVGHGLFDVGSGLLQGVGAAAGGVGDIIGKGLQLIPGVKQVEGAIGQGVGKLAQTAPGQAIVQAGESFAAKHPTLAKDIGAAGNIAGLVGGGIGAKVAKDAAAEGVGQAAREGIMGGLIQNAAKKSAINDALEVVAPKETAGILKKAVKQGRATEEGMFSGGSASPDTRTIRAAEAAVGVVNKSKSDVWNANAILKAIGSDATELENQLAKERPFIAGAEGVQAPVVAPVEIDNLLNQALEKIGEDPTMVGNAEESAKRIFNKFKNFLPQDKEITASDLLKARKKLDNWIGNLSGGGKVFDPAYENAKTIALRAIRQGANDLMAVKAPDVEVKNLLAHQTALYDALDNVSAKAAKTITKSKVSQFAGRHPIIMGGLKYAAGGAAAGLGIKGAENLIP